MKSEYHVHTEVLVHVYHHGASPKLISTLSHRNLDNLCMQLHGWFLGCIIGCLNITAHETVHNTYMHMQLCTHIQSACLFFLIIQYTDSLHYYSWNHTRVAHGSIGLYRHTMLKHLFVLKAHINCEAIIFIFTFLITIQTRHAHC